MRRIFAALFVAVLVALAFTACSDETENVEDINKQTLLVYMPWSGSDFDKGLYDIFLQNLDSIESAIRRNKGMKGRALVFISRSASASELYEMVYDEGKVERVPVKTYSGNGYTTAAGITEILNDVKANAYALNYAMMIGCHGSGWTYKEDWTNYPVNAKRHVVVPGVGQAKAAPGARQGSSYPTTRFFGSVSDMDDATDITTLAEGIRGAGLRMQFVLFDDCYMANVETAYALRDVSNFLIGSTSEVMALGMPYQTIWNSVASPTPAYDAVVREFDTFYRAYIYPYGALSAIDCRKVEALAQTMREINGRYTLPDALMDSVQVLDGFDTPIFYDMGDYVDHLCKDANLLSEFHARLDAVIRSTATTDTLYSALYYEPKFIEAKRYSGITISDPSRNSVAVKGKERTAWWQATH